MAYNGARVKMLNAVGRRLDNLVRSVYGRWGNYK